MRSLWQSRSEFRTNFKSSFQRESIRAVRGIPVVDAPDVDDRGWVNRRAAGLNVTDARGALVGIAVGDTVRLQVVREDLDATMPLFVTNTGNEIAIQAPAGGGPIPASGLISVTATSDTVTGSKIQIRMGAADGPVICDVDAHTFSLLTLNITPHICTIHQAATPGTTAVTPSVNGVTLNDTILTTIFDIARAIWRPAGIDLNVSAALTETYTGFLRDDFASQNRPGVGSEENLVMRQNQVANTCNIYFLRFMDQSLGVGVRVETRAAERITRSGIMLATVGSSTNSTGATINPRLSTGTDLVHEIGNDVAHEIGHFLTLPHANNVDSPGLLDTYGRRRLMHPQNLMAPAVSPLTATSRPRFTDIGYGIGGGGNSHRGCLITLKDHSADSSDGEVIPTRRRFRSPNLFK